MRRILVVSTVAMVMALVTVAMALPAFASHGSWHGGEGGHCVIEDELTGTCSGGYGFGGSTGAGGGFGAGGGGHSTQDPTPPEGEPAVVFAGGSGQGFVGDPISSGGGGGRCELATWDADGSTIECVGGGGTRMLILLMALNN